MKNTIKKVLCTALAAVSLSAFVTVPSSVNTPKSGSSLVNVVEADAAAKYADFDFYFDGFKTGFFFKILENDGLWGRETPDGNKVRKFKKGEEILIDRLRFEKYSATEHRVWARTYSNWDCNDKKSRKVWICVARGIKPKDDVYFQAKIQARCTDKDFCGQINLCIAENVKIPEILNEFSGGGHGIYCRRKNVFGQMYAFFEAK